MNILDEIVSKKRIRVSEAKSIVSIEDIPVSYTHLRAHET